MKFSGDVRLGPPLSGRLMGSLPWPAAVIEAALSSPLAIPRKTSMLRKMDELCYPPMAEAKAIPTRTVKLRLALARQPLEPARTEVRLVEVAPGKRNGAAGHKRFRDPASPPAGSSMIRRLRLLSGLVMLAYVTMHLANHAVGLISLKAMEDVLWYIFRIWTNRPAQLLLYSSFLVHYALALYALWQRRTLRLRLSELSQIVLGFGIPLLLVRHVVVTRISDSFFHTDVGYYAYLLWVYFVRSPDHGFVQMLVLVVAWSHAMIGLHFWLRVRP
jgi:hypothetical protein